MAGTLPRTKTKAAATLAAAAGMRAATTPCCSNPCWQRPRKRSGQALLVLRQATAAARMPPCWAASMKLQGSQLRRWQRRQQLAARASGQQLGRPQRARCVARQPAGPGCPAPAAPARMWSAWPATTYKQRVTAAATAALGACPHVACALAAGRSRPGWRRWAALRMRGGRTRRAGVDGGVPPPQLPTVPSSSRQGRAHPRSLHVQVGASCAGASPRRQLQCQQRQSRKKQQAHEQPTAPRLRQALRRQRPPSRGAGRASCSRCWQQRTAASPAAAAPGCRRRSLYTRTSRGRTTTPPLKRSPGTTLACPHPCSLQLRLPFRPAVAAAGGGRARSGKGKRLWSCSTRTGSWECHLRSDWRSRAGASTVGGCLRKKKPPRRQQQAPSQQQRRLLLKLERSRACPTTAPCLPCSSRLRSCCRRSSRELLHPPRLELQEGDVQQQGRPRRQPLSR